MTPHTLGAVDSDVPPEEQAREQGRGDLATRFRWGVSGNPAGRPRGSQDRAPCDSVRRALLAVARRDPALLERAWARGLKDPDRAHHYLLLAARLLREIGPELAGAPPITAIQVVYELPDGTVIDPARLGSAPPADGRGRR
jgi:hypothetical protein